MHTPASSTAAPQRWAEAPRDQPRAPDPFPWRLFLLGVLPGLAGAVILLAAWLFLEQRANRQILYVTPAGQLAAVRADGGGERTLFRDLRLRSAPRWSPDGSRFAVLVEQNGTTQLLIARPGDATPLLIAGDTGDNLLLPGQPWSDDGAYVALVRRTPGNAAELLFADVAQSQIVTTPLHPDSSLALAWQPRAPALLVTTQTDAVTPTLAIAGVDGAVRALLPQDEQRVHGDGAWSPDGIQIAYVAGNEPAEVAGSIWIAQADGSGARMIVPDGVNLAPVWAPGGSELFFTRMLTETGQFDLYRVQADGQNLTRIGPSSENWRQTGIDRSSLLDWSPDGSQMFFQGVDNGQPGIYAALADGSNARLVATASEGVPALLTARWMPNSRAVLIAESGGAMRMEWVNQDVERRPLTLPEGRQPALQP